MPSDGKKEMGKVPSISVLEQALPEKRQERNGTCYLAHRPDRTVPWRDKI